MSDVLVVVATYYLNISANFSQQDFWSLLQWEALSLEYTMSLYLEFLTSVQQQSVLQSKGKWDHNIMVHIVLIILRCHSKEVETLP